MNEKQKSPLGALRADTYRQYGKTNYLYTLLGFCTRRTFRVIVTMRLCQALASGFAPLRVFLPFMVLLHRITTQMAAVDFSWRTKVGAGLAITHGWGMVVNQGAVIGGNVTLFHGVTLGRRDRLSTDGGGRTTEYPVIEDEVWIGPHAIIVGGVTVGKGSRIAGGAFVQDDVPPRCIVLGNPGRIVKTDCVPDVMNPAALLFRFIRHFCGSVVRFRARSA